MPSVRGRSSWTAFFRRAGSGLRGTAACVLAMEGAKGGGTDNKLSDAQCLHDAELVCSRDRGGQGRECLRARSRRHVQLWVTDKEPRTSATATRGRSDHFLSQMGELRQTARTPIDDIIILSLSPAHPDASARIARQSLVRNLGTKRQNTLPSFFGQPFSPLHTGNQASS